MPYIVGSIDGDLTEVQTCHISPTGGSWRAAKRWFARGSGEKESFETKKDSLRFGSYVGVSTFRSFVNEYWLNSYFLSTFFRSYDTHQID